MIEERLIRADATKLDELAEIMAAQEHAELLHPIGMQDISIGHKTVEKVCDAVKALTPGKKVLMVTGPTLIVDTAGNNVKERVRDLLEKEYEVDWFVLSEPDSIVHATPENAAKIQARFEGVDCVVGIGGGTICDLCKYATFYFNKDNPLPLVIVQTALSVNAFSDNSSVMLINGVKRTVHSRYPTILIIDLGIVGAAPAEMNVSGYGDLIATWTAPVDWYLGNVLGMGKNFHTAPSDMIRTQCEELLENSEKLAAGDAKVLGDLANVLTLSGLSMGLADESSPASGSEHVMSHLIDMASGVRHTGICYHGTQVAVSGINSCIIWDYLLNDFDPKAVDLDKCYPSLEEMEPKVKAAFDWLDDTHSAANECWADYEKKLTKWHANKEKFRDFLDHFDEFKATVAPWVKKPEYIADCMHKANAPCRYSVLNFPVDAKTATWAMNNCHLMRNRFSVIDLLFYTGVWNEDFVQKIIERADGMDAGL
ncbi:MAG: iron-containing alcohol dehydrogenase [Oscillospiraceae bacterium]|nr:iron-containing alcohol dehydrogenase [Oscillospiraceae bacterium]